ncbi:hypothetical protein ACFL1S_01690 [Pseudomonadota bacterium]
MRSIKNSRYTNAAVVGLVLIVLGADDLSASGILAGGFTQRETEPNNSSGTANKVDARVLIGDISGGDNDYFSILLIAGETITGEVFDGSSDTCSSDIDSSLELLDTDGSTLLATDDNGGIENCSRVSWTVTSTGKFYIKTYSSNGTDVYDYSLIVSVGSGSSDDVQDQAGICGNVTVEQALTCSSDLVDELINNNQPSQIGGECVDSNCYACGSPTANLTQTNEERVYRFNCQTDGQVDVSLQNLDCNVDVYVLSEDCGVFSSGATAQCVAGSTNSSTTQESVSFMCYVNETYYISVENYSGSTACNFDLSFNAGAGTGCQEDCDNGVDDDFDGDTDCDDSDCSADSVCAP